MAQTNPTYDLMLLLQSSVEEEQKNKILSDTEATIGRLGEVIGRHDWGLRPTAYELHKRTEADYHLLQFHGGGELLATLERTLRITDGVERFRIIKLAPGTPAPPDGPALATAASGDEGPGAE